MPAAYRSHEEGIVTRSRTIGACVLSLLAAQCVVEGIEQDTGAGVGEVRGTAVFAGQTLEAQGTLALGGGILLHFTDEEGRPTTVALDSYGMYSLKLPEGRFCVSASDAESRALELFEYYQSRRCVEIRAGEIETPDVLFPPPDMPINVDEAYPGTVRHYSDGPVELDAAAAVNLARAPVGTGLEWSTYSQSVYLSIHADEEVERATGLTDEALLEHVEGQIRSNLEAAGLSRLSVYGEVAESPQPYSLLVSLEGEGDVVSIRVEFLQDVQYYIASPEQPIRAFTVSAPTWQRSALARHDGETDAVLERLDGLLEEFTEGFRNARVD